MRVVRVLRIALPAALLIFGSAIWWLAFRAPPEARLSLPPELIALDTLSGQQLLADTTYEADYATLSRAFQSQARPAFCGVATSVTLLNALEPQHPATQLSFFNDDASKVRSSLSVTFSGMTLADLAGLLQAHGLTTNVHYASDSSLEEFRTLLEQNLSTRGDYIAINYQRAVLGQRQMGHISPLGAYNGAADRVLILDVAAYKYPPAWVPVETLWRAMNTIDTSSGRTRGYVLVGARDDR
jgi:hypothetical protein